MSSILNTDNIVEEKVLISEKDDKSVLTSSSGKSQKKMHIPWMLTALGFFRET